MSIHSILFSGPMVRAKLEGRKWQTRRCLSRRWSVLGESWAGKKHDRVWAALDFDRGDEAGNALRVPWVHPDDADVRSLGLDDELICWYRVYPPYVIGDLLWVRETLRYDWTAKAWQYDADKTSLEATRNFTLEIPTPDRWPLGFCPSIHMPRWASRLTLKVAAVKVERLQDISEDDAIAEGIAAGWLSPIDSFRTLWDSINGQKPSRAWADNPWVAAITFETIRKNVMEIANAD